MWLYIPSKTLSPCSQGSEDSTLQSNSSSRKPELWLSASGKAMQRPLSWQGWKTRRWMKLLSGVTLPRSKANRGAEKWIASLEDFPARTSPTQASAPGSAKEPGQDCSTNMPALLAKYDPDTLSWRTSQACWITGQWALYLENFPAWGSLVNGECFQRQNAAVRTNGKGFSSWPTPTTQESPHPNARMSDTGRRISSNGKGSHGLNLEDKTGAWPTPRALEIDETEESWKARMDKRVSEGKEGFVSQNLCMTTKSWPTPVRSDFYNRQQSENWDGYDLPSTVGNWSTPVSRDSGSHTITENHPDGFNKNLVNDAIRWPTPAARDYKDTGENTNYEQLAKKCKLPGAANTKTWPTPSATETRQGNQHRNNKDAKGTQQSLTTIAMKEELWDTNTGHQDQMNLTSGEESSRKDPTLPPRWQTPVTLDQVAGRDIANQEKIRRTLTNADLSRKMMGAKKRLNVTFVEWLMGHPIGWSSVTPIEMSVYKVWAMESFLLLGRLR